MFVLAGVELVFFIVAATRPGFGIALKTVLTVQRRFSQALSEQFLHRTKAFSAFCE